MEEAFEEEKDNKETTIDFNYHRMPAAMKLGIFGDYLHLIAAHIADKMVERLKEKAKAGVAVNENSSILNSIGIFMMAALGGDDEIDIYSIKTECTWDLGKKLPHDSSLGHKLHSEVSVLEYDYGYDWSNFEHVNFDGIKNLFTKKYKEWMSKSSQ